MGLTYLFIAHDLSVVKHISNRIGVMYLGKHGGAAPTALSCIAHMRPPLHPQALISADSRWRTPSRPASSHRIVLQGDVPSPTESAERLPFPHPLPLR